MYNTKEKILILDFGGKYTQLIARAVRDLNVYSEVKPYTITPQEIKEYAPRGIILAEGSKSVYDKGTLICAKSIVDLGIPILGICNGSQLIADLSGGGVAPCDKCGAVQYHPEIIHTEFSKNTLEKFLFETCGVTGDWKMSSFVAEKIESLKEKIGDKKVLCALSGGVDSSVSAVMLHKAIGKQLICIFVDHGLLRKNEGDEVEKVFRDKFDMNLIRVNAQDRFLSKLAGVTDPETKRKIIGSEFIRVFEEEAKKIGVVDYLVQGTIYPDIIESGIGDAALVKSHHNVGGLPDHIDFKEIIEPLRDLFKDEVRKAGLELSIPDFLVMRQPFPGPGLAVRVIGEITREKLDILREADYIFREEIEKAGLNKEIQQYFAIITDMRSVGVKGETRTYDYTVALRAISTIDYMTANFANIPYEILSKASERIVNEVNNVNRVVYDITRKPPATVEWE